jgi:hypothetical protein
MCAVDRGINQRGVFAEAESARLVTRAQGATTKDALEE